MHVVVIEPGPSHGQRELVRGLRAAGATVSSIGERPLVELGDELASWLESHEQVAASTDEDRLAEAVDRIAQRRPVERVEASRAEHVQVAAAVRERLGVPGTSAQVAAWCHDKAARRDRLLATGVACTASAVAGGRPEARAAAAELGYPVVVKPTVSRGRAAVSRVKGPADLEPALVRAGLDEGATVLLERALAGHEGFYDAVLVDGEPVLDFVCHTYPSALEAAATRWISPQVIATNRIEDWPFYEDVRALGRKVVAALELDTTAMHMQWFFGPDGLRLCDISCCPPPDRVWDLYCAADDLDLYRAWGLAVTGHPCEVVASRSHAAGLVTLRPDRDGHVVGVDGIGSVWDDFGQWIVDSRVPEPGEPTGPADGGFLANGWLRVRHPDYDQLRGILDAIGERVQIRAE